LSGERVAKNSVVLIAAEVVKKILGVVTSILIARALAVDDFGRLRLAMALVAIFEVLANFGLGPLLTREVAGTPEKGGETFGLVQGIKMILGLLAAAGMIGFAVVSGYDGATLIAVIVAAGIVWFSALEASAISLLDGYQSMGWSSAIGVVRSTLVLLAVAVALGRHGALYGVVGAYLFAAVFSAGFGNLLVAGRLRGVSIRPRLVGAWRQMRQALPFLLIGVVWMLLFRIDTIMLEALKNEQSVGLYSSGYVFFELLLVVPILSTRALFPALTEARATSPERWRELMGAALRIYWILALPIAIGSFFVGARFVPLLYGAKYAAGGYVVPLLGSYIFLWFGTMTVGWALSAADRLGLVLRGNVLAMLVNIAANFLLIPRFDFFGAAVATIISEAVLLTYFLIVLRREEGGLPRGIFPWRALPAAAVLVAATAALRSFHLALVIIVGAVLYLGGIWALGALRDQELEIIRRLVRRKPR